MGGHMIFNKAQAEAVYSAMTVSVTGHRITITKSRSHHYTLTIREVGTWSMGGKTYPHDFVVLKEGKLDLDAARNAAKIFKAGARDTPFTYSYE